MKWKIACTAAQPDPAAMARRKGGSGLNGCTAGILKGTPRRSACHLKKRYTKRRLGGISAGPFCPQCSRSAENNTGFSSILKSSASSLRLVNCRYANGEIKSKYQDAGD